MDAGRDLTAQDFNIAIRPAGQSNDDWSAFPEASAKTADDWSAFPEAGAVTASGMAKQSGVGVAKGAIGIAGMPGDAQALAASTGTSDYLSRKFEETFPNASSFLKSETARTMRGPLAQGAAEGGDIPGNVPLPTSSDIQGQVEKVTGPFREPQNQSETDAQTLGEFVPAALAGPGGVVRKLFTQAAVPATASIVAGRYSNQNPYVKALAGFLAGGAGAALTGPSSIEGVIRGKLPASVTEQDITRAGQLIEHAQQRGVAITWPEALTRVTGQPILTDTQRILESHAQTRPQMQEFFAGRPGQVENAARGEFDRLGQMPASPSTLGPQAAEASSNTLNNVRRNINEEAQPYYDASRGVTFSPEEYALINPRHKSGYHERMDALPRGVKAADALPLFSHEKFKQIETIPGYAESLAAVRNGPNAWRVQDLPDNSVGVLNEVKKHFDQMAKNAGSKFNPEQNATTQATHEMAASAVRQIGIAKSAEYEIALAIEEQGRKQFLEPIMQGPIGKLAKKDMTTQKAINVLFPENPVPGTEGEIRNAVFALARQRPAVAEQLVRAHLEMTFNQAARDLQGGANQFAGAKFAVKLAGNSQQRANLQAAVEALPNGNARWRGLEQLLDIASATGARQPKGSLTAFNELEVKSMSSSGLTSLAAKAASPGKYMTVANDAFKAWSLGRNLDQLARIITDPRSGDALRQIVRIPPGSDRAAVMVGRLILQLGASTTEQRKAAN